MKTKMGRMHGTAWKGVACLGLLPLAVSCSSQKTTEAAQAYNRGFSYAEKGEYDQAIADFTEAVRLDPTQPTFYMSRAKAFRALGNEANAASDEKKAQELKK